MSKINNTDILLLGFIIIISLIFFIFYPKLNNNIAIEQKIEDNKLLNKNQSNIHNDIFNEKNNKNVQSTIYNPISTYSEEAYYDINGFQNELIPKYKQFVSKTIESYFIEPKKDIPLDYAYVCKKSGDCPSSKEQKYDIPIRNLPLCYLKDNKELQLSKQIKNKEQYGITEIDIKQDEFNIIKTLDKNTKELPIANINVNFLEKTNSSFISKDYNINI